MNVEKLHNSITDINTTIVLGITMVTTLADAVIKPTSSLAASLGGLSLVAGLVTSNPSYFVGGIVAIGASTVISEAVSVTNKYLQELSNDRLEVRMDKFKEANKKDTEDFRFTQS